LSRGRFEVTDSQAKRFLAILTAKSIIVTIERFRRVVLADPDDDKVLEAAHRG
jgi:hypothetical protein